MNNFLLTLAAIVLLAIGALFAVPPMVDWNQYRGVFEEEVSRFLGREVRVGGDVRLRILPIPYVGFEKVRIADAPGISGSFVRAERFTLWLSVPPLLRGVIEARKIEIEQPELRLRFGPEGGGNWQTISLRNQHIPFVPRQIALQSVNILDGRLSVENAAGRKIAALGRINGELTAAELAGPYRFIGTAEGASGEIENIRVTTARAESDGSVRLNVVMRAIESPATVALDGTLSELATSPKFAGTIKSRAQFSRTSGKPDRPDRTARRQFDLVAKVAADSREARFEDMAVSFDSEGRPQLLVGNAKATWQDKLRVDGRLASRWLDLDSMFGIAPGESPLRAMERLAAARFGIAGHTTLDISVEQANLGGEAISGLLVRLGRMGDKLSLRRIQAALPGGTTLAGDGELSGSPKRLVFDGHTTLTGASLQRFAAWAKAPLPGLSGRAAGKFSLETAIKWRGRAVDLSGLAASIGGGRLSGTVTFDWSENAALDVDGVIEDLDLTGFGTNLLDPDKLIALLRPGKGQGAAGSSASGTLWSKMPFDLRLRGARIGDEAHRLKRFDLAIGRKNDTVQARRLKFELDNGLAMDASGRWSPAEDRRRFMGRGIVSARAAEGARQLFDYLGGLAGADALTNGLGGAAPMRLAFEVNADAAGPGTVSLEADGQVRGDHLWLQAKTDGPLRGWRSQNAKVALKIAGDNAAKTAAWLRGRLAPGSEVRRETPISMTLEAAGTPAKGLLTVAAMESAALRADFKADVRVLEGNAVAWAGRVRLGTGDLARAARVYAPELVSVAAGVPAEGLVTLTRLAKGQMRISPEGLRIADSTLRGTLTVTNPTANATTHTIAGALVLDRADAGGLFSPLLASADAGGETQQPSSRCQTPTAGTGEDRDFWTDRVFDLRALNGVSGGIALTIGVLQATPEVALRDVGFTIGLQPGRVSIADLTARLRGAGLEGSASFLQEPAGVLFQAKAVLKSIAIARFAPAALKPRFAGSAHLSADVSGRGLSPRALAAAVRGKGEVRLGSVKMPGLAPAELTELARLIVAGESDPKDIGNQLEELARAGTVRLSNARLPLTITDGAAKFGVASREQDGFRLENRTTVDILRWAVDSEWRIWPRLMPTVDLPDPKPLPEVVVVHTGPLRALSAVEPRVSAGTLQRELTVRRMEADVARLERLRREDEERARLQAERLKQLEEERRRALEIERLRQERERSGTAPPQPPAAGTTGALPPGAGSATEPPSGALQPPQRLAPAPLLAGPPQAADRPREREPQNPAEPGVGSSNAAAPQAPEETGVPQPTAPVGVQSPQTRPQPRPRRSRFDRRRILDPAMRDGS